MTNNLISLNNDDGWQERLWRWADENDIPKWVWWECGSVGHWKGLPRDSETLLNLTDFEFIE